MNTPSSGQEKVLSSLLRTIVFLGAIAYIPSLIACIKGNLYLLAVIDTVGYMLIAGVMLFPRSNYQLRLTVIVLTTLILGGAVLFTTGSNGAGHLWLITGVVISALFGKFGIIVASVILAQLIMLLYGILVVLKVVPSDMSMISLFAIFSNMLLISIALSLIIHHLLAALNRELAVKDRILELLHHRVHNNLQTIGSLVALESDTIGSNNRIARRIEAISRANELLLADPSEPKAELGELLSSLLRPGIDQLTDLPQCFIPPEQLTETAVGISDVLENLKDFGPFSLSVEEKEARSGNGIISALVTISLKNPPQTPQKREILLQLLEHTLFHGDFFNPPEHPDRINLLINCLVEPEKP